MQELLGRDRFIFANQRRMLTSLSPYFTANTSYETSAQLYVHNSKLTRDSVTVVASGYNCDIKVYIEASVAALSLAAAPSTSSVQFTPGWTDDKWVAVQVTVKSTSGTGGYFGLYILEDALTEALLP